MLRVPGRKIREVFRVAGQPLDRREVSRVGEVLIKSPEAADETFGVLCDRLGEIAACGDTAPMMDTEPSVPFKFWTIPARS